MSTQPVSAGVVRLAMMHPQIVLIVTAAAFLTQTSGSSPIDCKLVECEDLPEKDSDGYQCQVTTSPNGCCNMCAIATSGVCGDFYGICRIGLVCEQDEGSPDSDQYGYTGTCVVITSPPPVHPIVTAPRPPPISQEGISPPLPPLDASSPAPPPITPQTLPSSQGGNPPVPPTQPTPGPPAGSQSPASPGVSPPSPREQTNSLSGGTGSTTPVSSAATIQFNYLAVLACLTLLT